MKRRSFILAISMFCIMAFLVNLTADTQVMAATKYLITYKLYGGKNSKYNPASYSTKDVVLKNPTKKGYTFQGWYTEPTYVNKITTIKATKKKNYKLYAKWKLSIAINTTITIPTLKVEGNWPCGTTNLKKAWKTYYPYFAQFLGEAAYKDRVLTWSWDSNISDDFVDYSPITNQVNMGPVSGMAEGIKNKDYDKLYFQMMHESGHLFYQYNKELIRLGFGQWIFEAFPLAAESLTRVQLNSDETDQNLTGYDIAAYMGDNCINGVLQDCNKYQRTVTDSSASGALQMLIQTLSYDSGFDYLAKVNHLMFQYIETTSHNNSITKEEFGTFLDEAANGRTIDGMTPSKWLYSQPVANTSGDVGDFIAGKPVEPIIVPTKEQRIRFFAFSRFIDENGDLKETSLDHQVITFKIYNQKNQCVQTMKAEALGSETDIELKKLPVGLYKIQMSAKINNKTVTNYNYFMVYAPSTGDFVMTNNDNRMFILPIDQETQTIVPFTKGNYKVTGAMSYRLESGALLITAAPGAQVKITLNGKTHTVTKPVGIRVVPIDTK